MSADLAAQKAQQMQMDATAFDLDEYIRKLRVKLYGENAQERQRAGEQPKWQEIGRITAKYTREPPQVNFL